MTATNPTRPAPPRQTPPPIQRVQFSKEDFTTESGVARMNTVMSQLTGAVQALQGSGGPSVLPSGVDVAGARVTGLAAPQHSSDAISAGHAQSQFSADTLGPQLDIGGSNALKGLTGLQIQQNRLQSALAGGVSGTITLAKLTVGGTNGSITVTSGIITAFTNAT